LSFAPTTQALPRAPFLQFQINPRPKPPASCVLGADPVIAKNCGAALPAMPTRSVMTVRGSHHRSVRPSAARRARLLPIVALLAAVGGGAPGCALHYQDSAGRTHILGFAAVTIEPSKDGINRPHRVGTRNIGAMIHATPASRGISLGYNAEEIIYADPPASTSQP
jgi:hypothetical protein